MTQEYDIKEMAARIKTLRETATELKAMGNGIQAIDRNVDRILANVRMLEIDVAEVVSLYDEE